MAKRLSPATAADSTRDGRGQVQDTGRTTMARAAIRRTLTTASLATLLLVPVASAACGQAAAPGHDRVIQQDPDADAIRAGADANRGSYAVSPPNERDSGAGQQAAAGAERAGDRQDQAAAPAGASDLGTAHDPFVVENSQPRSLPLAPASRPAYQVSPPNERDTGTTAPVPAPRGLTGTCRAGGSDCLPDEDYPAGTAPAEAR
jgi:hypothetical protein